MYDNQVIFIILLVFYRLVLDYSSNVSWFIYYPIFLKSFKNYCIFHMVPILLYVLIWHLVEKMYLIKSINCNILEPELYLTDPTVFW